MTVVVRLLAVVVVALFGCQRSENAPSARPSAAPAVAAHTVAAPQAAPSPVPSVAAPAEAPSVATSPGADEDEDEGEDEDENKPMGPDFEIDADANRYFTYAPALVLFAAKPLNGEPPFTYTWDFADGSPAGTGPRVQHVFDKIGTYHVKVTGMDKTQAKSGVELIIQVASPEDFAVVKHLDPATLSTSVPTPIPWPTP